MAHAQTPKRDCPPGQRPGISGCIDGSAQARVRADPKSAPRAASERSVPRPDPALTLERAKPTWGARKSKELLIRELKGLERMLRQVPSNSPDMPIIVRRLAEGYADLEMIAERERAAAQAAADDATRAEREAEKARRERRPRGRGTVM